MARRANVHAQVWACRDYTSSLLYRSTNTGHLIPHRIRLILIRGLKKRIPTGIGPGLLTDYTKGSRPTTTPRRRRAGSLFHYRPATLHAVPAAPNTGSAAGCLASGWPFDLAIARAAGAYGSGPGIVRPGAASFKVKPTGLPFRGAADPA